MWQVWDRELLVGMGVRKGCLIPDLLCCHPCVLVYPNVLVYLALFFLSLHCNRNRSQLKGSMDGCSVATHSIVRAIEVTIVLASYSFMPLIYFKEALYRSTTSIWAQANEECKLSIFLSCSLIRDSIYFFDLAWHREIYLRLNCSSWSCLLPCSCPPRELLAQLLEVNSPQQVKPS